MRLSRRRLRLPRLQVQSYQEISEDITQRSAVEIEPAAVASVPEVDSSAQIGDKVQEIRFYLSQQMWEPAKAAILDLTELAPDAPEITELIAEVSAGQAKSRVAAQPEAAPAIAEESPVEFAPIEFVEPPVREPLPPSPVVAQKPQPVVEEPHVAEPPQPIPAPVLEMESVLDIPEPPKPIPAPLPAAAAAKDQSTEDILGDFILDLEESDLADFAPSSARSEPVPAKAAPAPAMAQAMEPRTNGNMQDAESANVLSDILSELREETSEASEPEEDPETHYNLGIAFKEMGLLDEAIGELQKVCHAVDRGAPFSQPIQALTWLAQCLVDKGVPEAAVRWYQKALQLPGMDSGSRCAIYYDLGAAYQASGDNKSALANFMEVYGSNIDFRDVASRIKELKS